MERGVTTGSKIIAGCIRLRLGEKQMVLNSVRVLRGGQRPSVSNAGKLGWSNRRNYMNRKPQCRILI
jgi:hypothetical protein